MLRADKGELKDDISAEERRWEGPVAPIALEVGLRIPGFDASGVLFLFPIMLLAIVIVGWNILVRCQARWSDEN